MVISDLDVKILWGRSAGRCSWCNKDLLPELSEVTQGDMAHIIAKSHRGPRGSSDVPESDRNKYENLILLCPNHHRLIDSEPDNYTVEEIQQKKKIHEEKTRNLLEGTKFTTAKELFLYALKLLNENKYILEQFGPNSPTAKRNPGSNAKEIWDIRKRARIIPNNSEVIAIFEKNTDLLNLSQASIFNKFREHAIAFQQNANQRLDKEAVPMFPVEFRIMLEEEVKDE